jgi:hypothetical protein
MQTTHWHKQPRRVQAKRRMVVGFIRVGCSRINASLKAVLPAMVSMCSLSASCVSTFYSVSAWLESTRLGVRYSKAFDHVLLVHRHGQRWFPIRLEKLVRKVCGSGER